MDALRTGALLAATLTTGLMAGLFYAYSISVMPALRATPAPVLTEVMQRINRAIVNGWFLLAFAGALFTGVVAVVLVLVKGDGRVLPWAVAGLVLYAAQLGVTVGINIPLNNALDAAGSADPEGSRAAFERRWTRANTARTWLCVVSFACWCLALAAA